MLPALIAISVMMLAATGSSPSPDGRADEESAADGGQRHAAPEEVRRWVEQTRDGDMQAFRRLYDEFLPYVRYHVGRLVGPEHKVDDLVQEVFVEVYDGLSDFEFRSKFKTWLYRVTRNVTISHLRGREETIDLDDVRPLRNDSRMLAKLEARDQVRALYSVLEQCKPESREAFILHEVEEMKLREIAEMTDTSINTVGSRVRRTREKLRTFLESKLREEAP